METLHRYLGCWTRRSVLTICVGALAFVFCNAFVHRDTARQIARHNAEPSSGVVVQPSRESRPARGHTVDIAGHAVDLSGVIEQTHLAFHERAGSLVGGDISYGVKIDGSDISIHPEDHRAGAANIGGALAMRTIALKRGGVAIAKPARYAIDPLTGHADADAGAIVEQLANTPTGLEQSWRFDERPQGSGDLEIRVATRGEPFLVASTSGVHFRDLSSGLGMVYSHARWIDATGAVTDVPVRYEAGQVVLEVPTVVIDTAAYPAVLDPTVGPEYAIDAPIDGPAVQDQTAVSIGHSGTLNYDFLVVWQDNRRTTDTDLTYDVFGAHVDRNGVVREVLGFVLNDVTIPSTANPQSDGNQTAPHAVWAPHLGRYVVIWASDQDHGEQKIFGRVFASTATVADTTECAATTHPSTCPMSADPGQTNNEDTQPTIAIDPINDTGQDRLLVAWRRAPSAGGNGDIVATEIPSTWFPANAWPAGGPHESIVIGQPGANDATGPAAAGDAFDSSSSSEFIIAAANNDLGATYGIVYVVCSANVDPTHNLICPFEDVNYISGHPQLNPAIAPFGGAFGDSSSWLLTWQRNDGTSVLHPDWNIYAEVVGHDGSTSAGTLIAVSNPSGTQQTAPAVAGFGPNNTQAFVTWKDTRTFPGHARGARVNISNGLLSVVDGPSSSGGIDMGGNAGTTATHSDEVSGYFTTWNDARNGSKNDIYGANVPFSAAPNSSFTNYLISKSANKQTAPAITKCDTHYLVAWTDSRNEGASGKDIYGAVLNSDGTVAVGNIKISGASGDQDHPAIGCSSGTGFFVVWEDFRNGADYDIYGEPVGFDGSVADPVNGLALATEAGSQERHPSIIAGTVDAGPGYLVVYDYLGAYVRGVMIKNDGTILVSPFDITIKGVATGIVPDVDFDGTSYIVVWQTAGSGGDIQGATVSSTGTVGVPFTIENDAADQRYPRVRFDAASSTATVVYEDDRNLAINGTDIFARRITTGGSVGTAFAVASSTDDEYTPRLALRSGALSEVAYFRIPQGVDFNYDVWGQSLNAGATSGAAFAISNASTVREMTPSIACDTGTSCVAPYRKFDPNDGNTQVDRVVARLLSY